MTYLPPFFSKIKCAAVVLFPRDTGWRLDRSASPQGKRIFRRPAPTVCHDSYHVWYTLAHTVYRCAMMGLLSPLRRSPQLFPIAESNLGIGYMIGVADIFLARNTATIRSGFADNNAVCVCKLCY